MTNRNFFAELKRRNVYKVAAAYVVVAWLLIQAASIVLPTFEAPGWTMKVLIAALAIGFPIAVVFAWAFEITPEGIKRESQVEPDKSITHHTGRRIVGLTIALAAIAAGLLAYQLWGPKRSTLEEKRVPRESTAPVSEKSIAVLPFENLSDDKSNAYFTEGIQDEILTRLSKIAALKVISRTSTQKYKSAPDNLRDVGQQLGVGNLLEGSVQKIANSVHVNVQLIRVATDEHLWAESYNRKLDDVFAVEGEVASAIAEQLNAKLTGAEQKAVAEKPTQNLVAYDAYLRGAAIEHSRYSYDAYQEAAREYAEAVRLDPNFGLAWARLAVIRSFLFFNTIDPVTNTPAAVKQATERAMTLAPEAGESWVAQGAYRYRVLRDFEGAVSAYKQAQAKMPSSSYVLENLAFVLRRLGRWDEAEAHYKKALELDPRDVTLLSSFGSEFYNYLRRFGDARAVLERAVEISPDADAVHGNLAAVFQNEGRLSDAAHELSLIRTDSTDDFVLGARITQALYERNFSAGIEAIERKLRSVPESARLDSTTLDSLVQLGFCQEWIGRPDDARRSFERAVTATKPTATTVVAPDSNGTSSILALAYAGLGEKQQALEQAQRAVTDFNGDAVNKPLAEIALAQIQARFGEMDNAIAALPHLLEVPAGVTRADLRLNPMWDPLRNDPRFQKLCEEKKQ